MIESVVRAYPNVTTVATTLRTAHSANVNGWGAICYHQGEFYEVAQRGVEIMDRVGGGDSFASGFIYGLLSDKGPQWALECGVAHGALAHVHTGRYHHGDARRGDPSHEGLGGEDRAMSRAEICARVEAAGLVPVVRALPGARDPRGRRAARGRYLRVRDHDDGPGRATRDPHPARPVRGARAGRSRHRALGRGCSRLPRRGRGVRGEPRARRGNDPRGARRERADDARRAHSHGGDQRLEGTSGSGQDLPLLGARRGQIPEGAARVPSPKSR